MMKDKRHVVFVEDEPLALELISESLKAEGYLVSSFVSAKEALAWLEKEIDYVDILITDQSMPKMTGVELAEQARMLKNDLPVVIVTGAGNIEHDFIKKESLVVLEKPYKKKELFEVIIKVMG